MASGEEKGGSTPQGEKELEVVIAGSSESDSAGSKKASRARVGSKRGSNSER